MATKTNLSVPSAATTSATQSVATAGLRPAKPPVPIPGGWSWVWWLLALGLLAAVAWFAWRRWRRKKETAAATVVVPPHVRARDRLRAALALIDRPEPFCVAVSGALRVYLEEALNLRAPEQTTEEFLDHLQSSAQLALGQKRTLGDFLVRCDLVKFARYTPVEAELRELWDAAMRLVEETRAGEAPSPAAAASGPHQASPSSPPAPPNPSPDPPEPVAATGS